MIRLRQETLCCMERHMARILNHSRLLVYALAETSDLTRASLFLAANLKLVTYDETVLYGIESFQSLLGTNVLQALRKASHFTGSDSFYEAVML